MSAFKTLSAMIFAVLLHAFGNAQCTAVAPGDWYNPSNWSCGYVPGCGDLIIIPAGITINLDDHLNIEEADGCNTPTYIQVFGILRMQTGKKINMSCGSSVEIMTGGSLQHGIGGGMSNWIQICGTILWNAGMGHVPGYALFGSPIPLPTTITSFDVQDNSNELFFTWNVESERNVDRYQIESSIDGINWTVAAAVSSRGDATEAYIYSTSLPKVTSATYFRLRSIDNDGTSMTFSKTLYYEQTTDELVIYPNPASSDNSITIRFAEHKASGVQIYDQTGNLLYINENTDDLETIQIEGNTLAKGMYIVKSETALPTLFVVE